ncbi:MAG TPA: universal stress protein, partial [Nocardioides sp.]|nr:universal stress protein [Nocardioides sp.]
QGWAASEHGRVRRVSCAFRGDDRSHATLRRTAEICTEIGASLRLVTFAVRGRTSPTAGIGIHAEDMVLDRWVAQATAAQEAAVAALKESGNAPSDVESVVAQGRTWGAAIDRLDWDRDEVLVLGSSEAGVIERIFLGSNASKIVRHSPVPVVVVP